MKLDYQDVRWALMRMPNRLRKVMEESEWHGNIFVGGGFLRSVISGENINDVDVFVKSKKDAELLAHKLAYEKNDIYTTDNAYTIKGRMPIQIIYRWLFEKPEDVSDSFDFTVCCAVLYCKPHDKIKYQWDSFCDDRFYTDLSSKRLVYRHPKRNEDAGGSMLRVLKYYQRGYRIPLDSLAGVISRLVQAIDQERLDLTDEKAVTHVVTGLLREVDPDIDPTHIAHLPSMGDGQ